MENDTSTKKNKGERKEERAVDREQDAAGSYGGRRGLGEERKGRRASPGGEGTGVGTRGRVLGRVSGRVGELQKRGGEVGVGGRIQKARVWNEPVAGFRAGIWVGGLRGTNGKGCHGVEAEAWSSCLLVVLVAGESRRRVSWFRKERAGCRAGFRAGGLQGRSRRGRWGV